MPFLRSRRQAIGLHSSAKHGPANSSTDSKVPEHLRPFFRPSFTTEPQLDELSTSISSRAASSGSNVALYPPHWRLRPSKRTVKEKLTDILLKDWQGVERQRRNHTLYRIGAPTNKRRSSRAEIMRMKDSDDYLTARAANPRTGVISPSIGSRTPRVGTPETPGEVLELVTTGNDESPPPAEVIKIRPPLLRRANQARKVSADDTAVASHKWRPDGSGWTRERPVAVLSPRVAHIKADAGVFASQGVPLLAEDRFVVKMPSAREPQPYSYPGYSGGEIEALKVCKVRETGGDREGRGPKIARPVARKPGVRQTSGKYGELAGDGIRVTNRKDSACLMPDSYDGMCDRTTTDERAAAAFAPFSSPRTRKLVPVGLTSSTPLRTLSRESDTDHHQHQRDHTACGAENKASHHHHYYSIPSHRNDTTEMATGAQDLRHLPQIKLVHPSHAGIPQSQMRHRSLGQKPDQLAYVLSSPRKCSLGCPQDPNIEICLEQRRVASESSPRNLFDRAQATHFKPSPPTHVPTTQSLPDFLLTALISLFQTMLLFPSYLPSLPRPHVVEILSAADASPAQKAGALKSILVSAGQILVVLTVLGLVWEIGGLVGRTVGWVFWPVGWIFRVWGLVVGRA